ncbi:glycosyltransferase [Clostridium cochlearium]|uniref:Glycosyltransferase n=2 Tax=Clostridium TaxID=1485 RepID=A0A7Y3XYL6_CLOCO|nr:glycosyltransferase [Clostridium cochlearium]NOH16238.1 glycosyltransferase [Clostridium cochlearium]
MKVLFCHDGPLRKDEYNNYYGTAHNDDTFRRYYTISKELAVMIRVNEISRAEAELRLSKITVSPFKVVECPNISSIKGMLFNKQKAEKIIYKEVDESDYIVIRLPSFIGNLAVDVAQKLNKPYLLEVVACPWDAFWNHSFKGKVVAPFMYYATKKRVLNAPYVVYVTSEFLQKRYPTKGKNTNCSNVALTEFDDSILVKRLEKIKNMKDKDRVVLGTTAAVDVRYKGQQYIIKSLGKLKERGITNYEYHLVGGGDQTYLKSVAKKYNVTNQVKFLGAIPHDKVFKWLDTIDIYAQPSRQEGLPRALIEAMSRGVPAFGARTAGIPELLESEYIFSNTRRNIDEICNILIKYDLKKMQQQAICNFNEAKKYDRNIIEMRRKEFFLQFKNSINKC